MSLVHGLILTSVALDSRNPSKHQMIKRKRGRKEGRKEGSEKACYPIRFLNAVCFAYLWWNVFIINHLLCILSRNVKMRENGMLVEKSGTLYSLNNSSMLSDRLKVSHILFCDQSFGPKNKTQVNKVNVNVEGSLYLFL